MERCVVCGAGSAVRQCVARSRRYGPSRMASSAPSGASVSQSDARLRVPDGATELTFQIAQPRASRTSEGVHASRRERAWGGVGRDRHRQRLRRRDGRALARECRAPRSDARARWLGRPRPAELEYRRRWPRLAPLQQRVGVRRDVRQPAVSRRLVELRRRAVGVLWVCVVPVSRTRFRAGRGDARRFGCDVAVRLSRPRAVLRPRRAAPWRRGRGGTGPDRAAAKHTVSAAACAALPFRPGHRGCRESTGIEPIPHPARDLVRPRRARPRLHAMRHLRWVCVRRGSEERCGHGCHPVTREAGDDDPAEYGLRAPRARRIAYRGSRVRRSCHG
jgi:hypothetical protein